MRAALMHRHSHFSSALCGIGAGNESLDHRLRKGCFGKPADLQMVFCDNFKVLELRILSEVMICFSVARRGRTASAGQEVSELKLDSRLLAMQQKMKRKYIGMQTYRNQKSYLHFVRGYHVHQENKVHEEH